MLWPCSAGWFVGRVCWLANYPVAGLVGGLALVFLFVEVQLWLDNSGEQLRTASLAPLTDCACSELLA